MFAEEEQNLAVIRQREQDILQLEGDIVDLNQIYKDLGMMVHEQVKTLFRACLSFYISFFLPFSRLISFLPLHYGPK